MKAWHVGLAVGIAASVYALASVVVPPKVTPGTKIGAGIGSIIDGVRDLWGLRSDLHGGDATTHKAVAGFVPTDGDAAIADADGHAGRNKYETAPTRNTTFRERVLSE